MKIRISRIKDIEDQRPDGYITDVLASGIVSNDGLWLDISTDNFQRLMAKYRPKIKEEPKKIFKDLRHEQSEQDINSHPLIVTSPSIPQMLKTASNAAVNFARSGFVATDADTLATREATCKSCDLWDAAAINGTGRCKKCGCSTWAKLRMASEKCPIGKW